MPDEKSKCGALTIGQLAKRWGISPDRARGLVETGQLPGAFVIPSVGRYGATLKIPLSSVLQVEQDWIVVPEHAAAPRRRPGRYRGGSPPKLKHFPDLGSNPEPDAGCHGADQH